MRLFYLVLCLFILFFSFNRIVSAEIKIAVIGKTKNDSFYQQSFKGCQQFSGSHKDVTCFYDGPADYQDIRGQADVIRSVVEDGVDGILVSTTDSAYLVNRILKRVKSQGIPVITFDSDLLPEHSEYRLAYVGTDNFDYGMALGNYAKKFKTAGYTEICIQSGHKSTPNLNERIRGVRFALSGNDGNRRLNGENGWIENIRCPLYTMGKRKSALFQLGIILEQKRTSVFIAVAGFAQFSPEYIPKILPHKKKIISQQVVIVSADTEDIQLQALKQNLSTVNIGQRPFEMGRIGTELLYDYIKNNTVPEREFYYLDFHYCTPESVSSCIVR
ncbi:sugar-binding protein [Motiliproteus sp. MSK22-1]|nr:sugar-binding protein [Motiliproteus sp. MSK22-1]